MRVSRVLILQIILTIANHPSGSICSSTTMGHRIETSSNNTVWNTFLENLYAKFSEYEIQKSRSLYNVAHLEDWKKENKQQGLVIDHKNFDTFIDMLSDFNIDGYESIKNETSNLSNIEQFNQLIQLSLQSGVNSKNDKDTFRIEGHNVKFSDFLDDKGKLKFQSEFPGKLTIFALNKVFVDKNLEGEGKELLVTIIAPKLQIIGQRKINLMGENGKLQSERQRVGKAGCPGLPGGAGGSLFVISEEIIDGDKLTVNVSGGKGGPGQNGMKGEDGEKGYRAMTIAGGTYPECTYKLCWSDEESLILKKDENTSRNFHCWRTEKMYSISNDAHSIQCNIYIDGIDGTAGENGGDGGAGGNGGHHGNVTIILSSDLNKVHVDKVDGESGEGGVGADGGKGGTTGGTMKYWRLHASTFGFFVPKWEEKGIYAEQKPLDGGKRGENGRNTADIQPGKDAKNIFQSVVGAINGYKTHARRNLNHTMFRHPLIQFLDILYGNDKINNYYNTIGLVEELKDLENDATMQSVDSKGVVDFYTENQLLKSDDQILKFYKSLLSRISHYANNLKGIGNLREHKKVLAFAYTSALSRTENMKNHPSRNLFVDVISFLKFVKTNFNRLQQQQELFTTTVENVISIEQYRKSRIGSLDDKIREATEFVKSIKPDFNDIENEITRSFVTLVNEVKSLENEAANDVQKLNNLKGRLGSLTGLRVALGALKLAGVVANCFGPVGIAVSTIITTSAVVDPFLSDSEQPTKDSLKKLPESVESIRDFTKTLKQERINNLKKALEKLSDETAGHKEVFKDTRQKAEEISKNLEDLDEFELLDELETQFKNSLEQKETALKSEKKEEKGKEESEMKDEVDEEYKKPLEIIDKVKKFVDIGAGAADFYFGIREHTDKIKKVDDAVKEAEKKFMKLREYELSIYKDIKPTIRQMEKYVRDASNELVDKSRVALRVSQWNVQKSLKDTKLYIREVTKGYKVIDAIQRSIEKLEEILTILIGVYDQMQGYQEDKNLSIFIADVSSAAAKRIIIKDTELAKAENELKKIVTGNLLLQQYRTAIEAFKQFAFPYASQYLTEIELPENLRVNEYVEDMVQNAAGRINRLVTKLEEEKPTSGLFNACLSVGKFDDTVEGVGPFYIWRNQTYNNVIGKLLSGDEVQIFANVELSPLGTDAIKFNEINFRFVTVKETLQKDLDTALSGFKLKFTHTGDSYYRYNNEIYRMTTNERELGYHLQKDPKTGEPIHTKVNTVAVKNGDSLLSPYTLWNIQLKTLPNNKDMFNVSKSTSFKDHASSNVAKSFEELKPYKNAVDLHLDGKAWYVEMDARDTSCVDPEVHKFYTPIDKADGSNGQPRLRRRHISKFRRDLRAGSDKGDIHYGNEKLTTNSLSTNPSLISDGVQNQMLQLPPASGENIGTRSDRNFEGSGLLMLADLLCRSYTGEKYKRATSLCPMQERAEKIHELKERVHTALAEMNLLSDKVA